ncbi:uncharacterized protein LOC129545303 isoform X1 [Moschus berezovskii]|uniref:uncharacterized protein LOC129545303 isoform X1 n=1 Tax=Moschus berezovskii TaxID=68408 RepID=UPI002444B00A|nr:uncharacterized protein LOC129545303 isoform X1 [Moschus berezovskii]
MGPWDTGCADGTPAHAVSRTDHPGPGGQCGCARFPPLCGVSGGVCGVPPTSEMESGVWRGRGWGPGICRVRGREDWPQGHCHRQRLRQERSAPVPPWSALSGTKKRWASGNQVDPPTPGQGSSLGVCVCVCVCACVKQVWVVTRSEARVSLLPPQGAPRNLASLKAKMHRIVDDFCDAMGNEPEEAQMQTGLAEMEEKCSNYICEFIDDHIQETLPESLQESSPLLQEARQEIRRRIQRPSVSACLEVQNPEESIWARALRGFLNILQGFLQGCQDVLTWLWQKAVAFLEAICSVVKTVCGVLMDFCSAVGQLFCKTLIQV